MRFPLLLAAFPLAACTFQGGGIVPMAPAPAPVTEEDLEVPYVQTPRLVVATMLDLRPAHEVEALLDGGVLRLDARLEHGVAAQGGAAVHHVLETLDREGLVLVVPASVRALALLQPLDAARERLGALLGELFRVVRPRGGHETHRGAENDESDDTDEEATHADRPSCRYFLRDIERAVKMPPGRFYPDVTERRSLKIGA